MRRIMTASLLAASLLLAACGGSDDKSSTETGAGQPASSSTLAGGTGTDGPAAPPVTKVDGPGCKTLKGYLNAELIARKKVEDNAVGDSKDQLLAGLDNTSGKLRETFPQMVESVDARLVVVRVQLDGGEPAPEQVMAADTALKTMNNYLAVNCAPPSKEATQALPGATSTTAAP